jgi:hypothetical protein
MHRLAAVGGAGQNDQGGTEGETGSAGDDLDKLSPDELLRKAKALKDEQARHYNGKKEEERKRLEAEAERDELKKKQDEADRKGKSELENLKSDVESQKSTIESQAATIKRLTVANAFLELPDIEWHNPKRALTLVDLSEVEFDDKTGEIKDTSKLVAAAKNLAKTDAYLVKSKTAVGNGTPAGKPTGSPPAGGKGAAAMDDAAVKNKYNLNNR